MQKDSSLQQSWLITEDVLLSTWSFHMHAESEEVSTQFLTDGVTEQASITFSAAFTSKSAMIFLKRKKNDTQWTS